MIKYLNRVLNNFLKLRFDLIGLFALLFLCIVFSVFVERLTFLGQPKISFTRFGFAAILISALYIKLSQGGAKTFKGKKSIVGLLFYFFFCAFSVVFALLTKDEFSAFSFYLLYSHFVLWGYLIFYDNIKKLDKLFSWVFWIAGVVGTVMVFAGPEAIKTAGIGALEGRWGQFTLTDENGVVDALRLFRSFSIFPDHQTYSGFLQVMAFYFRFRYHQNSKKYFIILSVLAFLFNLATFSTTGLVVIALVLVSFFSWGWIVFLSVTAVFLFLNVALVFPELFALLFHTSSLEWRIIFIERALNQLSFYPQMHLLPYVNFTADNHVLWGAYKYGYLYGVLYFVVLVAYFIGALFSPKNRKVLFVFGAIIFINTMTNGVIMSTPNNIITPIILGLLLRDSVKTA